MPPRDRAGRGTDGVDRREPRCHLAVDPGVDARGGEVGHGGGIPSVHEVGMRGVGRAAHEHDLGAVVDPHVVQDDHDPGHRDGMIRWAGLGLEVGVGHVGLVVGRVQVHPVPAAREDDVQLQVGRGAADGGLGVGQPIPTGPADDAEGLVPGGVRVPGDHDEPRGDRLDGAHRDGGAPVVDGGHRRGLQHVVVHERRHPVGGRLPLVHAGGGVGCKQGGDGAVGVRGGVAVEVVQVAHPGLARVDDGVIHQRVAVVAHRGPADVADVGAGWLRSPESNHGDRHHGEDRPESCVNSRPGEARSSVRHG